jgi:hypothetical protein
MYFFGKPAGERRGNFRERDKVFKVLKDLKGFKEFLVRRRTKKSASDTRKPNLRTMRLPDYFSAGASAGATSAGAASAAASHFSHAQASPSAHLPQHSPAFSHCSHFSQHAFSSAAAFFLLQLPQQPTIATAATRTTNEKIFFIALMY